MVNVVMQPIGHMIRAAAFGGRPRIVDKIVANDIAQQRPGKPPAPQAVPRLAPVAARAAWYWFARSPRLPAALDGALAERFRVRHFPPSVLPRSAAPVLADGADPAIAARLLAEQPCRRGPLVFLDVAASATRAALIAAGADDALSDTISPAELAARLTAIVDRHGWRDGRVAIGRLQFDLNTRRAMIDARPIATMPREFDILLHLARADGGIVSRTDLLRSVWQIDFDPGTNSVEVHVCRLRKAIERVAGIACIETVKGAGYRLDPAAIAPSAIGAAAALLAAATGLADTPSDPGDSDGGLAHIG